MATLKIDWNNIPSVSDTVNFIRHQLGEPIVKVEITNVQILENIYLALDLFLMYAAGLATEEAYYALQVLGGVSEYDLGEGVLDVLDFDEFNPYAGGINTLFTLQNQMKTSGMLDFNMQGDNTMIMLNYHLALDFIETLKRYSSTTYQTSFDPWDCTLILTPEPKHEYRDVRNSETGMMETIDSPGVALLKVKQFIGAGRSGWTLDKALSKTLSHIWVKRYALALCKITLGRVRSKFSNFQSIGNTGIALDGSDLLSEGASERDALEAQLIEEQIYTYQGYGIETGIV